MNLPQSRLKIVELFTVLLLALFISLGIMAMSFADDENIQDEQVNHLAYSGVVEKIIDGDTFLVKNEHSSDVIRLWGVDTPEWNQPFSKNSKNFLQSNILKKEVYIKPYYLDKFGRTIAQVFIDDKSINQILVEMGFAWVHIYYCDREICVFWKRLEEKARNNKSGLWQSEKPVPPWKWKKFTR